MRALAALVVMLAACATPAPAQERVTRVTYENMSWGYVLERWVINDDGAATLEVRPQGVPFGEPTTTTTLTLTPADFMRIREALAPAEAMLKQGVPCERIIMDAPYGAVRWQHDDGTEGAIRYDFGCRANPRLGLFYERMDVAGQVFHAAAGQ